MLDAYLLEAETSGSAAFSPEQLVTCALDLFTGGTETTSKTLQYLVAFMVLHPEVQEEVAAELAAVAPRRQVTLADQEQAPLTQAVITESWRLRPVIPVAPSRLAAQKVTIGNHAVPAGTSILSNIYAVHTDPAVWPDPHAFQPERHLGIVTDRLITFGSGRRRCPGEVLARAETFLLFANLMAGFLVEEGPEGPPCLDGPPGLTAGPRPFTVRVRARSAAYLGAHTSDQH